MSAVSKKREKRAAKKYWKKLNKIQKEFKKIKKETKRKLATRRSRKRKRSASTSSSSSSPSSFSSDSSTDSSHDGEPVQGQAPSKVSFSDKENIADVSRNLSNKLRSESPEISRKISNRDEPMCKKRKSVASSSPILKKCTPLMEQNLAQKNDSNVEPLHHKIPKVKKAKVAESYTTEKNEDSNNAENQSIANKEGLPVENTLNTSFEKDEQSVPENVKKQQKNNDFTKNEGQGDNKNEKKDESVLDKSDQFLSEKGKEFLEEKKQDRISDVAKKSDFDQGIKSTENKEERQEEFADGIVKFSAAKTSTPKESDQQIDKAANQLTNEPIVQVQSTEKVTAELPQEIRDTQTENNDYEKNVEILRQFLDFPKNISHVLSKTRNAIKNAEEFLDAMGMNEEALGCQTSTMTKDCDKNLENLDKASNMNQQEKDEPMIVDNENEAKLLTATPRDETLETTKDLGGKTVDFLEVLTMEDGTSLLGNLANRRRVVVENKQFGPAIAESLVSKWSSIMIDSLDENVKEELLNKHSPPENFPHLQVPILNPQLKNVMNEIDSACDQDNASIQMLAGSAISAVGKALTILISDSAELQDGKTKKLKNLLGDAGKILAYLFHVQLLSRMSKIIPKISEVLDIKYRKNLINEIMFGKKFAQTWRNSETGNNVRVLKNEKVNTKIIKIDKSSLVDVATSPIQKKAHPQSGKPRILNVQVLQNKITSAPGIPPAKLKPRKTMAHSTPRLSSKEVSMIQARLPQKIRKLSAVNSNATSESKKVSQNQTKHDVMKKNREIDLKAVQIGKRSEYIKKLEEMKKPKWSAVRKCNDSMQQLESSEEENFDTSEESDCEILGEEEESHSEDDKKTENEELDNSTEKEQSDSKDDEENNSTEFEATDTEESQENIVKSKRMNNSKENEEVGSKDGINSKEKEENNSKLVVAEGCCSKDNEKDDSKQEDKADSTQGEKQDSNKVKDMSVEEEMDSQEEQKRKIDKHCIVKHKHLEVAVADSSKLNSTNCSLKSTKDKKNTSTVSSRGEQASNSQDDCDSGEEKQEEEKIHSIDKTESWISCRSGDSSVNDTHVSQTSRKSEKIISEPIPENQGQVNFPPSWKNNGRPHELLAKVMQVRLKIGKKSWQAHSLASNQENSNVPASDSVPKNTPEDPNNELQELEKP